MVFSSLIFIFAFLPVQMLVYYLTPTKYKKAVLLLFSIIFYAWSGPPYLLILAGLSLVSYLTALGIEKTDNCKKKKIILAAEVITHLSVLIFFKYLAFGIRCINSLLGLYSQSFIDVPDIVLPIGISFYTFQLLSYVIDVYKGKVKANRSYLKVLLYAGLFHQCIAGPIVRYETVAEEIENRTISIDGIFSGVLRFSTGLVKKAVFANSCASVADACLPLSADNISELPVGSLWMGALFYAFQIYLDFSAYSDMAIGMGRMTGFHYLENFNYPYIARTVTDFWRRWHISLSSFFRDYVYIPLGGNRVKPFRHIINLLIVWMLTGLWHGASGNFIAWGLYYFVFLILEKYIGKLLTNKNSVLYRLGAVIYRVFTLFIIVFGWVIFRFDSFDVLLQVSRSMLGFGNSIIWNNNTSSLLASNIILLIVSIIISTPLIKMLYRKLCESNKGIIKIAISAVNIVIPALLIIISALALAGDSYNPFIYYRF